MVVTKEGALSMIMIERLVDYRVSYRGTHGVAHAEVKATLFVHGVVQTRKLRQRWPVMVKWVIPKTVIGTAYKVKNIFVLSFSILFPHL